MKIKHKNHMTLLDVEKSNKIHDHFIMTALKKLGIEQSYVSIIKAIELPNIIHKKCKKTINT